MLFNRFIFYIFLVIITPSVLAAESGVVFEDKLQTAARVYFQVKDTRISQIKSCVEKKCSAYKFANEKKPLPKKIKWISGGGNPASILCKSIKGTPKIGYLHNNNEVSLCYFSDDSFIFSWDLIDLFKRNLKQK